MKRIAAIAAVLLGLLSGGAAHALGPVGTLPEEPEGAGTTRITGGILHREIRLLPRRTNYSPIKLRQNHVYAELSESAFGWEVGGRLGVADFSDGERFDAGYKPFGGIVVKGSIYGDRFTEIGLAGVLRADLYSGYRVADVQVGPSLTADVRVKDLWDAEAALLAYRRFGRATFHGGPVLQYVEGKMYRTTASPVGTLATEKSYYMPKTLLGLIGGLSWQRGDANFGIEAALSGNGYSASVEAGLGF